jgi:hypothetical protein
MVRKELLRPGSTQTLILKRSQLTPEEHDLAMLMILNGEVAYQNRVTPWVRDYFKATKLVRKDAGNLSFFKRENSMSSSYNTKILIDGCLAFRNVDYGTYPRHSTCINVAVALPTNTILRWKLMSESEYDETFKSVFNKGE